MEKLDALHGEKTAIREWPDLSLSSSRKSPIHTILGQMRGIAVGIFQKNPPVLPIDLQKPASAAFFTPQPSTKDDLACAGSIPYDHE
jgi:hypothetical protein